MMRAVRTSPVLGKPNLKNNCSDLRPNSAKIILRYYLIGTFGLSQRWEFPGNISIVTLGLMVAIAVNALFAIGVAVCWCRYFGVEGAGEPKRRAGQTREVLEIDPANVPPFQATWRNIQ